MPANKDFKRLVRRRMAATGERYTEAHAHLTAGPPAVAADAHREDAERRAGRLLAEFAETRAADPTAEVTGVLAQALAALEPLLASDDLSPESLRLARSVFVRQWDMEAMTQLLARYLTLALPVEEEFWARWQYADALSILGRHAESFEVQAELLEWTRQHLSPQWLPEVIHDSTMFSSWNATGRRDEWLAVYEHIDVTAPATAENRVFRYEMNFTALQIFDQLAADDAHARARRRLEAILAEDPDWEDRRWAEDRLFKSRLMFASNRGDVPAMAAAADDYLKWADEARPGHGGAVCRDIAFVFSVVGQHGSPPARGGDARALAIDFFERSIAARQCDGYGYIWYASCVLEATGDRTRVTDLLREAARRMPAAEALQVFHATARFESHRDDAEFLDELTAPPTRHHTPRRSIDGAGAG